MIYCEVCQNAEAHPRHQGEAVGGAAHPFRVPHTNEPRPRRPLRAVTADETPAAPPSRPWPTLQREALYGLPGKIVTTILPHTEADPAAMLVTLYSAAGAMIGSGPHMLAGGSRHGARVWAQIVGKTASGKKGTSWAEIKRVLKAADDTFVQERVTGGLSSAEGLIVPVRDQTGRDPDDDKFDEGVTDKRLLVVEPEFASVLAQGKKDGNSLLPTLRQAWDGGTLRNMTVNPRVATDPHIVVIGHITPGELVAKLSKVERAGGTANRFLPILSRRSKLLPDGGDLSDSVIQEMGKALFARVNAAAKVGRMTRTVAGAKYWQELYGRLAGDHIEDGPVAEVIARAAPQVLRLSVTIALLDGARQIDEPHLVAAEALWSYVEDSAWWIFGDQTSNPDLDRLRNFVDSAGGDGATRSDINVRCFGRHKKKAELDALLVELIEYGGYETRDVPTGGRPKTVYVRTKHK